MVFPAGLSPRRRARPRARRAAWAVSETRETSRPAGVSPRAVTFQAVVRHTFLAAAMSQPALGDSPLSFLAFISWNSYRILVKFRLMLSLGRSPPLLTLYPLTMQFSSL